TLLRSTADTGASLGGKDASAYRRLMDPFVAEWDTVVEEALAPPIHLPSRPFLMARLARLGVRSAWGLSRGWFESERSRAFFLGIAAHVLLPARRSPSAAFGLMLALAGHGSGWPLARSGSQKIADAL